MRRIQGWEAGVSMGMFMNERSLVLRKFGIPEKKKNVLNNLNKLVAELDEDQKQSLVRAIDYIEGA